MATGRILLAGLMTFGICAAAAAQTPIGGAKDVQKDVRGQTGGRTLKIALGDQVFANEFVRTGADSLARIVFLDETNMSVGPTSEVKLDKYVYDPSGTAKAVVFGATKGAFRFFSGNSDHSVYSVQTPQAVIGVRGTVYDVKLERGVTTVVLVEGAVNVCVRNTARCTEMSEPGQSIVVRDTQLEGPNAPSPQTWNFGVFCGADPAASPYCTRTTKLGLDLAPKATAPKAVAPKAVAPRKPVPKATPPRPVKAATVKPVRRRARDVVETEYIEAPVVRRAPPVSFSIGIGLGGFRGGPRGDGPRRDGFQDRTPNRLR